MGADDISQTVGLLTAPAPLRLKSERGRYIVALALEWPSIVVFQHPEPTERTRHRSLWRYVQPLDLRGFVLQDVPSALHATAEQPATRPNGGYVTLVTQRSIGLRNDLELPTLTGRGQADRERQLRVLFRREYSIAPHALVRQLLGHLWHLLMIRLQFFMILSIKQELVNLVIILYNLAIWIRMNS